MKKKLFIVIAAAIVAIGAAAWNLNQKLISNTSSDLTLSNVDALAQESGGCRCEGVGSIVCPLGGGYYYRIVNC